VQPGVSGSERFGPPSEGGRLRLGSPAASPGQGAIDDGPPILDPFVRPAAPLTPTRAVARSGLATESLVSGAVAFVVGPLAGLAALAFGLLARREIATGALRGRGRATAGLVLGAVGSVAWAAAVVAGFFIWRARLDAAAEGPVAAPLAAPAAPAAADQPPPARDRRVGPGGTVPRQTTVEVRGAITLVEVGVAESSLASALVEQAAAASAAGDTLLVTTTRGGCEPCDGFVASLPHPLMQEALANVRVVRVDIDVFGDDLEALRLRHDVLPGFFLLDFDLAPRDAIHGGEWGEDIAQNIAPVLGPFVRGALRQRKHAWPLPPAPRGSPSDPRRGGGIWL
jgi:hypothetical protein